MGAIAQPAFDSMSIDELEQTRTALEVKLGNDVDFETRRWVLGYVDELIKRASGADPAESG
jgi:hypothetical protein